MTESEKIVLLQTMTEEENRTILSAYLNLAGSKVLQAAFPFDKTVKEVPECYAGNQLAIAAYLVNKRGAEGETAHSENGVSRSYENGDIPDSLLRGITPMVGVL